jgi:hypothetical protein
MYGVFDRYAAPLHFVGKLAHSMLRMGRRHSVSRHDNH